MAQPFVSRRRFRAVLDWIISNAKSAGKILALFALML